MQIVLIGRVEDVQTVQTRTGLQTSCQKFRLCLGTRFSLATIDEIFIKHISQMINTIYIHEGKSLNNRNFIITILQECLKKLFVSYFPTQSPRFATHSVHLSTSLQMPSRKISFSAWPLTNFAPPPLSRRHLQTGGPANVLSQFQTSDIHTAVCILNLRSSVDLRRFHTL